jgi:serine/threonine protein kinase
MPFLDNDIYLYIKNAFPEVNITEIKNYFFQVAKAIKYLHHDQNYVHNDIKPENIGLLENTVKLIDFEFARPLSEMQNFSEIKKIWSNRSLQYHSPYVY